MKSWALVVGFGNPLMTDDGVGPKAIELLKGMNLPEGVELLDAGTSALDAVPYLDGKSFTIIVDAVSAGGQPASVYKLSIEDLQYKSEPIFSLHSLKLEDAIRIWQIQLEKLPKIIIFGVEPKEVKLGLELSDEVKEVLPKLCKLIIEELNNARDELSSSSDR